MDSGLSFQRSGIGAVIIDGEIHATAATGTRKIGTDNWVTVDDKILIGSCGKAFSATLAGILVEEGLLEWHTTLKDVFPNIIMLPANRQNIISRKTKTKLHTSPNTVLWKYDDQYFKTWEKLIGWPLTSANYALGWYVLKNKEGEKVLHHGGATKSFIADVYVSPNYGSAILLATNARTSHIPLYEGAKRINAHYSLKISLP